MNLDYLRENVLKGDQDYKNGKETEMWENFKIKNRGNIDSFQIYFNPEQPE